MLVWTGDMNIHIGDVTMHKGMDGCNNPDTHHDFNEKKSERSNILLRDLILTEGGMEVMNGRQG